MPRRVKGPDGIVHQFPDEATDEQISEALGSLQQKTPVEVPRAGLGQMKYEAGQPPQDDNPREEPDPFSALRHLAHPQSAGDLLDLVVPSVSRVGNAAGDAAAGALRSITPGRRTGRAMEVIGRNLPTVTHPLRPIGAAMQGAGRWLQKPGAIRSMPEATHEAAQVADPAAEFARRFNLPSNAQVAADVTSKNIRTTPHYGGSKKPHITAEEFASLQREAMLKKLQ